jgi:hypothetical protein
VDVMEVFTVPGTPPSYPHTAFGDISCSRLFALLGGQHVKAKQNTHVVDK